MSIAELYSRTVFATRGVGGDAASVPGVQHGVAGIFCGVAGSRVTRRPIVSMAASLAGL